MRAEDIQREYSRRGIDMEPKKLSKEVIQDRGKPSEKRYVQKERFLPGEVKCLRG